MERPLTQRLQVGDVITECPIGAGKITEITPAGYPKVNGVAVVWAKRSDGFIFDPTRHKQNRQQ